jgi:hypothetical protein
MEGASVAITKDNMGGLSRLCDEFHFGALAERLSHFRESDDFTEVGTTEGENDRQPGSLGLELTVAEADRFDLTSSGLSRLSAEALDEILAGASFSIASEDDLLRRLLGLGDESRPLVSRIAFRFLSATVLAILAEDFAFPPECASRYFIAAFCKCCTGASER